MNLRDYEFQIAYGPNDNGVKNFYVPALSRSVSYDRSTGFFSSSALAVAAAGVARLIANGGRMRLLVGAQLLEDDIQALHGGADLAAVVEGRMVASLDEATDAIIKERLAALAWMIQHGTLEVRVVLPKGRDGHPLPAEVSRDYYHPKSGIFTDAHGDQVAFVGSVNESRQAWVRNYEQFMVYTSWNAALVPYITQVKRGFEALWNDQEDDWIGLPVPEAVRQQLVRHCPEEPPEYDPCEQKPPFDTRSPQQTESRPVTADLREQIIFQFLRDAPFLPNGDRLGEVASTVRLWPHQERVVKTVVENFPRSYMICDEVGLGKTLEGGGAVKQLTLTGRVKRCLILAPKSVCRQWQEELYEKFVLNVPLYDGGVFTDYFRRELPQTTENPWDAFPLMIASSQLAKRRERMTELYQAQPWDLVLVDEAHHARRKDFLSNQYRRNRLLSLLLGPQDNPNEVGLNQRTKSLILMTATPMQVDPREVWDLLTVLGLGGLWGASDDNFMRFFNEVRHGESANWRFVLKMVRDYLDHGGQVDPIFEQAARDRVGPVTWETIKHLPYSDKSGTEIAALDEAGQAVLLEFVRTHTPLATYIFRNTRPLLREYEKRGLLGGEKVPHRRPEPAWITMRPEERALYDRIEEYISHFYKKYEAERKGLGFIMTVYRRRLTSSFFAITKSLERRLQFLRGDPEATAGGMTDEDFEEDDLDTDVLDDIGAVEDKSLYREEMAYVEDFLRELRPLGVDSKAERLLADLADLLKRRETVIIFTLYTDTMDYLREKLRAVYGSAVACYSGRGGEVWESGGWKRVTKDQIKKDFKEERVKILLGTDALSEGLNLQTCGMMVNYDLAWNPMRVEQRIGRIDRIGQSYDEVWIRNYFYEDTVEARIYQALKDRISWFETVVGDLQPILARVARIIKDAAMESGAAREELLSREIEAIKREIDQKQVSALNLDQYVVAEAEALPEERPPVTQADLERFVLSSKTLKDWFVPHPSVVAAYCLLTEGAEVPVTFDPRLFDHHPSTMRLLSYDEDLFERLLDAVEAPAEHRLPQCIVRLVSDQPPLRVYYEATATGAESLTDLAALERLLAKPGLSFNAERLAAARADFDGRVEGLRQKEREIEETRRKAEVVALKEHGRHLLLKATYVDLAMASNATLFDKPPNTAGFTEDAVRALRRHGYPFAPLLKLVDTEGCRPDATDPEWAKVLGGSRDSLQKKFDATKKQIVELVRRLTSKSRSSIVDLTG